MGFFVEDPEGQRANRTAANYRNYDPFKELAQDYSIEHVPIVIPESFVFIPEDIEVFEVN